MPGGEIYIILKHSLGTRFKLDFNIAYYLSFFPYKILNTNQSYSIKLTTRLFVSAEITCNFSTREI